MATAGSTITMRAPELVVGTGLRRPLSVRIGKRLRPHVDRMLSGFSLVPDAPVLDAAQFEWTSTLRDNWKTIRDEALAVAADPNSAPPLNGISPDHARIAVGDKWRSFFLIGYGNRIEANLARCPRTAELVSRIPGLNSAFFSILKPGTRIPLHRGVTKGLLTCHLGLAVPVGSVRMAVAGRMVHWAKGETLVFDDTYPHEVWNETAGTRIVLLIQFERPLRQPGRALARAFLGGIRRTAFVKDAVANIDRWEEGMRQLDEIDGR